MTNRKFVRGTIKYVAKTLGVTPAAARVQLLNDVTKAQLIAKDFELQILTEESAKREQLKAKEDKIIEMKKNLGRSAV